MTTVDKSKAASGVEALIDRLREQGVEKGQQEAEALLEEAQRRARWLVDQARQQADDMRENARKEAEKLQKSGEDALKIAARDVQLQLKENLSRMFADRVRVMVSEELKDKAFLQQLLTELVCQNRDQGAMKQGAEVILPEHFIGLDELRSNPQAYRQGKLSTFVEKRLGEQLIDGIEFDIGKHEGLLIRFNGDDSEIDLSDKALSELLLRHLQPRFRALLEGVIR